MALSAHLSSFKSLCGDGEVRAAFIKGAIVVLVLYVLIFVTLALRSNTILKNAQDHLASKTVMIEAPAPIKIAHGGADYHGGEGAHSEAVSFAEKTAHGMLPILTAEGQSYFTEFQKETAVTAGAKTVSIMITDMAALGDAETRDITQLNENIAYAVSPYLKNGAALQSYLSAQGREIWMTLPIEHGEDVAAIVDPGPKALLSRLSYANNKSNLYWVMEQGTRYAGLATFSNQAFTKNQPVMRLILKDIFARGLGLVDLNPEGLGYFEQNAAFHNAPFMRGSVNLSLDPWQRRSADAFARAEQDALENGHALVVVPYYPKLIRDLKEWLVALDDTDITVVPPSAIAGMGISQDILFASPE